MTTTDTIVSPEQLARIETRLDALEDLISELHFHFSAKALLDNLLVKRLGRDEDGESDA